MKCRLLTLLTAALLSSACVKVGPELNRLESVVFEKPDSVLSELKKININGFLTRQDRAHYSLLYSQALDLNYIEVATDSIILPAVTYYSKHGSAKQSLKMCYYRALIAENQGANDNAMEWLKRGEDYITKAEDPAIAGRLYKHKASLYFDLYDYRDALTNAKLSAENFLKAGDTLSYAYRLNDIAKIDISLNDYRGADKALDQLIPLWNSLDVICKSYYYSNRLSAVCDGKDINRIKEVTESCLKDLPNFSDFPEIALLMARAYLTCGIPDDAKTLLSKYGSMVGDSEKSPSYHLLYSQYYEATGDLQNALNAYRRYNLVCGSSTVTALESDTKFIEERYEAQFQEMRQKQKTTSIMLSAFIILAAAILLIRYIAVALRTVQAELTSTEYRYDQIVKERNTLMEIQENSKMLDSDSIELVTNRLALLDKVFIGHLSSDPSVAKDADRMIEELLKNKENFILSTSKVFSTGHTGFCQYLKDSGLSDFEIGYCCLYVMGLYAKDIEPYFSKNSSNIINNTIRGKLNLPKNGVKLKTYLVEKCAELDKKQ